MISSTNSQMPMGRSRLALDDSAPLPQLPIMPSPAPSAGPTGAPAAQGGAAPMPTDPTIGAPAPVSSDPTQHIPYKSKIQPDGSSVYYLPGPKGDGSDDIILGLNPPPKMPKALQSPTPSAPTA